MPKTTMCGLLAICGIISEKSNFFFFKQLFLRVLVRIIVVYQE